MSAGVVASLVMAVYAMGASGSKDTGILTPLYHIASLWTSQEAMMASMEEGMAGSAVHVEAGPAVLGALIHVATGAMYGAVFGLATARLRQGLVMLAAVGLVLGALVALARARTGADRTTSAAA